MSIQPKLGVFDLTMIVVSLVIGVGIFRTPGLVAVAAGSPDVFFVAWAAGGLVSLCGALTFAEIGSRYHVAGGFYKVFSYAYHPVLAFMINWVVLLTYGASTAGVIIIGAEYMYPVILADIVGPELGVKIITVSATLLFFLINYLGIKSGARTMNFLTGMKIMMLLLLCLAVFGPGAEVVQSESPAVEFSGRGLLGALGMSFIAVFYTYGGYQLTINFGADVRDPSRNMPRAIFAGLAIIIILYLVINYAYYKVLGFGGLLQSDLVARDLAAAFYGEQGALIFSCAIFMSTIGYLNANLMANPRIYYAMAEDGILPEVFKRVNERTQVQEFALLFFTVTILVSLFLLDTFGKIVNYVMFIDSIGLSAAAAAIFILRKKDKDKFYDGFKLRFFPWVPLVFVVFLAAVSVNVLISDPFTSSVGIGLLLAGIPLYYIFKSLNKSSTRL